MSEFNPSLQTQYCRDVRRVHTGKAPSLSLVSNAYGRHVAETWLEIQLNDLSEFAGCKGKLTEGQLADTARMMLEAYGHFKLTEFMLFFQRFKLGAYGKFYGSVDPMVILQALREFRTERANTLDRYRREEERAEREVRADEDARLRRRYKARVPGAFTPRAAIDLLQYRMLGFDCMSDAELATELAAVQSGERAYPRDVPAILEWRKRNTTHFKPL